MKPTKKELEELGFYAEKQKADTLSQVPKIDTEIFRPITKPLEDFINDQKADGFTFENGVLTKHTTDDPYPFLSDIADLITLCRKMPIDPWKVAEIACMALENEIINMSKEEKNETN